MKGCDLVIQNILKKASTFVKNIEKELQVKIFDTKN